MATDGRFAGALRQGQNGGLNNLGRGSAVQMSELYKLILPYRLDLTADGRYQILNRRHEPLGYIAAKGVNPDLVALDVKFENALTDAEIAVLSGSPDTTPERIYLYRSADAPTATQEAWLAYAERLDLLAKLAEPSLVAQLMGRRE